MKTEIDNRKATAEKAILWIAARIAEGMTVYLTQYASQIEITPARWARFVKAGKPMFRAGESGLYIARGKSWDYVGWHKVTARG